MSQVLQCDCVETAVIVGAVLAAVRRVVQEDLGMKFKEFLHPTEARVVKLHFGGGHVLCVQQLSAANLQSEFESLPEKSACDKITEHYAPLAYCLAERKAAGLPVGAIVDMADLFEAAWEGLSQCVARFDRSRGLKLETYAPTRINGSMQDAIRAMDHVPRIERARATLGQVRIRGVVSLCDVGAGRNVEADPQWRKTMEAQLPDEDGDSDFHRIDDRNSLPIVMKGLTKSERIVLLMYYWQGCKMDEVAKSLGVCQSRASQIHTDLLRRFRSGELGRQWMDELAVGA
jgi:RNA polymerase sigma factor for flagellar operon FliA